jgi:hypothetical protein
MIKDFSALCGLFLFILYRICSSSLKIKLPSYLTWKNLPAPKVPRRGSLVADDTNGQFVQLVQGAAFSGSKPAAIYIFLYISTIPSEFTVSARHGHNMGST